VTFFLRGAEFRNRAIFACVARPLFNSFAKAQREAEQEAPADLI
jgi:hypothetical protein